MMGTQQTESKLIPFVDNFDREDGDLANGWIGNTWTISDGKVVNAPSVTRKLTETFDAWTDDNPNGWTVFEAPEDPENPREIKEVGSGEDSTGTGSGACNFTATTHSASAMYRSVLVSKNWYVARVVVSRLALAFNGVKFGQGNRLLYLREERAHVVSDYAENTLPDRFWFARDGLGGADITIDEVTIDQITDASELVAYREFESSDGTISATFTLADRTVQAGLALNYQDKDNCVLVYIHDSRLIIDKFVAGVKTEVMAQSLAPVADGRLSVTKVGTKYRASYEGEFIGLEQTIDEAFVTNQNFGIFGLEPGTQFSSFEVTPNSNPNLAIDTPDPYQVFQRAESNLADITISGLIKIAGVYDVKASWNGGAEQTIATGVSGAFTGTLTNQLAGQGALSVRLEGVSGSTVTVPHVGIGDVFVIAGQSNASGRGINYQFYTHPTLKACLFGNEYAWRELTDPTDTPTYGQQDSVSLDQLPPDGFVAGSVWPLLATLIMSDQGVPVTFIPCAIGGATIGNWILNAPTTNRSYLYGSMASRVNYVGGAKAVLLWLGESNAVSGTSQVEFNAGLDALANFIAADFGIKTMPCKLQNSSGVEDENEAAINAAIEEAWGDNANVLPGPDFSDLSSDDSFHLRTDEKLQIAANRWLAALKLSLYS